MSLKNDFTNKKLVRDTLKALSILVKLLDKYEIQYYLDFGTLIGAVREKGLIPWDNDIDLTIMNNGDLDKIKKVLKIMKWQYGYRTYFGTFKSKRDYAIDKNRDINDMKNVDFAKDDDAQIIKIRNSKFLFFGRGNVCIDIFFKYKLESKLYWMAYGKINFVPIEVLDEQLEIIDFCGIKCKILKNYAKYLTYKYGNWQVPNANWTHESDDLSIVNKK